MLSALLSPHVARGKPLFHLFMFCMLCEHPRCCEVTSCLLRTVDTFDTAARVSSIKTSFDTGERRLKSNQPEAGQAV